MKHGGLSPRHSPIREGQFRAVFWPGMIALGAFTALAALLPAMDYCIGSGFNANECNSGVIKGHVLLAAGAGVVTFLALRGRI